MEHSPSPTATPSKSVMSGFLNRKLLASSLEKSLPAIGIKDRAAMSIHERSGTLDTWAGNAENYHGSREGKLLPSVSSLGFHRRNMFSTAEAEPIRNSSLEHIRKSDRSLLNDPSQISFDSSLEKRKSTLFKNIGISEMINSKRNLFEGICPIYDLPDQKAHLIKLHGQVGWANNKSKKPCYLDEITNRVKRYGGKFLAPGDYPWDKQRVGGKSTKRYNWDT